MGIADILTHALRLPEPAGAQTESPAPPAGFFVSGRYGTPLLGVTAGLVCYGLCRLVDARCRDVSA